MAYIPKRFPVLLRGRLDESSVPRRSDMDRGDTATRDSSASGGATKGGVGDGVVDGGSVDVSKLPEAVRDGIGADTLLSQDAVNRVLGDAGDVLVRSLRRVGVEDAVLYRLTGEAMDAIRSVLSAYGDSKRGSK